MKLAIVGSQAKSFDFKQETDAKELINLIIGSFYRHYENAMEGLVFVSGGADGVDTWAEEEANAWGIGTSIHLPKSRDWDGYRSRNILIAEECTALYAIRSRSSKTYGSGWTADYAESIGKEVHRYYV